MLPTELSAHALTNASDVCRGIEEIAAEIGTSVRRAYYLAQNGSIPAFRRPGSFIWEMRRSTYRRQLAELEQAALTRASSGRAR
jgi:hypothetical protein